MKEMGRKGEILGPAESEVCEVKLHEVCCQGKMGQLPHQSVSEDPVQCKKMDLIHLDLVDP